MAGTTPETINSKSKAGRDSSIRRGSAPSLDASESRKLTAYQLIDDAPELRQARREREWMDNTHSGFPYRCLPLVIANQIGWEVLSPYTFTAEWNGGNQKEDIELTFKDGDGSTFAMSHFAYGVLTFSVGYLFRTPAGHGIWVKGPNNEPKVGITALEGIVETDWAPYTFTMNWKFTVPNCPVTFKKGEPVCLMVPFPRHYVESYDPEIRSIHDNPKLEKTYQAWSLSRNEFNRKLEDPDSELDHTSWQKSYFQGRDLDGQKTLDHQTKIKLKSFVDMRPGPAQTEKVREKQDIKSGTITKEDFQNQDALTQKIKEMVDNSVTEAVSALALLIEKKLQDEKKQSEEPDIRQTEIDSDD